MIKTSVFAAFLIGAAVLAAPAYAQSVGEKTGVYSALGISCSERYGKGGDNPELKNWANKNPADAARPPENGARPRQVMQPRIA